MSESVEFLMRSQNKDGGWGYRPSGMSYVEPTSVVIFALSEDLPTTQQSAQGIRSARDFLLSLQHDDGGWGIGVPDYESGWMTAWAVYALVGLDGTSQAVRRGVEWLMRAEGLCVNDSATIEQLHALFRINASLRGWPWQLGDASWVHPTAIAILALCRAGMANENRIKEGALFLIDRALTQGGWNIGNPEMRSQSMPPSVHDTAVSLLALNSVGRARDEAVIGTAIEFVQRTVTQAQAPADLAWGLYALKTWRVSAEEPLRRLAELQSASGGGMRNPLVTAVGMLAGVG